MDDKSVETLGSKIRFSSVLETFSSLPPKQCWFFYVLGSTYTTLNWGTGVSELTLDANKIEQVLQYRQASFSKSVSTAFVAHCSLQLRLYSPAYCYCKLVPVQYRREYEYGVLQPSMASLNKCKKCIRNWPLPIGAIQGQCKEIVINKHNWIPTGGRQTSGLFTSLDEKLNSGQPRTTSASGQNGVRTHDLQISDPALSSRPRCQNVLLILYICQT